MSRSHFFVLLMLFLLVSLVLAKPKKKKPNNRRNRKNNNNKKNNNNRKNNNNNRKVKAKKPPKLVRCRDWVRIQTPNAGLQVVKNHVCRGLFCTTGFRLVQKGNQITPIEFKGCGTTKKGKKVLPKGQCRNTGGEMDDDGVVKSGRICRCDKNWCNLKKD